MLDKFLSTNYPNHYVQRIPPIHRVDQPIKRNHRSTKLWFILVNYILNWLQTSHIGYRSH